MRHVVVVVANPVYSTVLVLQRKSITTKLIKSKIYNDKLQQQVYREHDDLYMIRVIFLAWCPKAIIGEFVVVCNYFNK